VQRGDEQAPLAEATAQLAGLEAAYRVLGTDALELTKARRYLEVRWGELLGTAELGVNQHSEGSHASEPSLDRMDRHRFRELAKAKAFVLNPLHASNS